MTVTQLINSRGNAVANHFVKTDTQNETVTFQSYRSDIVQIDCKNNTITFGRDWCYSPTTVRHTNKFLSDYFNTPWSRKDTESIMQDGVFYDFAVIVSGEKIFSN